MTNDSVATGHEAASGRVSRQGGQAIQAIARGGSANLIGAAGTAFAQLALTVVVTRALTQADAGVFFTVTSLFLITVAIGNLGANTGLVYFLARLRAGSDASAPSQVLRVAFLPTTVLSLVMAVGVYGFAEPLALAITPTAVPFGTDALRALAVFLPFASWESLAVAASRGTGSMRPNVVLSLLGRPFAQLLLVAAVLWTGSRIGISAAWGMAYVPAAVLGLWWMLRLLHRRRTPVPPSTASETRDAPARTESPGEPVYRRFWRFSSARALTSVLQILTQRFDIVLVAALASARDAAIYTAATRFVVIGQMASNALMMATQPRLAVALATDDRAAAGQLYRASTAWLVALSWPLYLVLIVFGETLLSMFGRSYAVGHLVIALISCAMLLSMAFGMLDTVLLMSGRAMWNVVNSSVGLAVQIGLDVLLIPHLGFMGAAIGWSAAIVVRNVVGLVMVHRAVGVSPFARSTWSCMGLATGCFLVVPLLLKWLAGPTWPALVVAAALGTALYAVGMWTLRAPLHLDALRGAFLRRPRASNA